MRLILFAGIVASIVLQTHPGEANPQVPDAKLLIVCDLACKIRIDGEDVGSTTEDNDAVTVPATEGEHHIKITSLDNVDVYVELIKVATRQQVTLKPELINIRQARLNDEGRCKVLVEVVTNAEKNFPRIVDKRRTQPGKEAQVWFAPIIPRPARGNRADDIPFYRQDAGYVDIYFKEQYFESTFDTSVFDSLAQREQRRLEALLPHCLGRGTTVVDVLDKDGRRFVFRRLDAAGAVTSTVCVEYLPSSKISRATISIQVFKGDSIR
jgi:hypothetical protein